MIYYMLNGKASIIHLTIGLIKMMLLYKMSYFRELHTHSKNKIEFILDSANYATKSSFKNATGVDTSDLAKKSWFSQLKTIY